MPDPTDFSLACPTPIGQYPLVMMAHGGGGRLMHQLIEQIFVSTFQNPTLNARHDSAVIDLSRSRIAFTTDSYVVRPIFFPGGDIGAMAVHGTVNDLAMSGARPLYLSTGFILEEGFPVESLQRVVQSMQDAAAQAQVQIITGDTKVVERGKGDGVYINTAGIGVIEHGLTIAPSAVREGDVLLINGDIGRHGMAVMTVREGLEFESSIQSDSAPLADLVLSLISAGIEIHCLRDTTRGGLASALNEIAEASRLGILIEEGAIPVNPEVEAACEILGFDPLYVACEGRMVAFVAETDALRALEVMRAQPMGKNGAVIGKITGSEAMVAMKSRIGSTRIVDMLSGEQLPRIC